MLRAISEPARQSVRRPGPIHGEAVYNVVGRHLKVVHPCGTGLVVRGLALPEMMMEVDVDAVIPEDEHDGA